MYQVFFSFFPSFLGGWYIYVWKIFHIAYSKVKKRIKDSPKRGIVILQRGGYMRKEYIVSCSLFFIVCFRHVNRD